MFTVPKPLSFGIFAQNLWSPSMDLHSRVETYPITLRAGTAARLYNGRIAVALDVVKIMNHPRFAEHSIKPHGGVEFQIIPDAGSAYRRGHERGQRRTRV